MKKKSNLSGSQLLFISFLVFSLLFIAFLIVATKIALKSSRSIEDKNTQISEYVLSMAQNTPILEPTTALETTETPKRYDEPQWFLNIWQFIKSYKGSRIDYEYLSLVKLECSGDAKSVRTIIAISVAETGMGRDTKKYSNFFGYFKGGNRSYDPSKKQMAKDMCKAVTTTYSGINNNYKLAIKYTGNDNPKSWWKNFQYAYNKM